MRSSSEIEEVHHLVPLLADIEFAVRRPSAMGDRLEGRTDHGRTRVDRRRPRGSASPATTCSAESSSSRKPAPPASTTPASFRTGSCSGVLSSARLPASRAARTTSASEPPASAAALGRLGALPRDGEDRSLDRLEHRLIGAGGRRLQRLGELAPRASSSDRSVPSILHRRCEAAQDLAEDDTAVAAGAHQRAVADRVARGGQVVGVGARPSPRRRRRACGPCSCRCRRRAPGTR